MSYFCIVVKLPLFCDAYLFLFLLKSYSLKMAHAILSSFKFLYRADSRTKFLWARSDRLVQNFCQPGPFENLLSICRPGLRAGPCTGLGPSSLLYDHKKTEMGLDILEQGFTNYGTRTSITTDIE